MNRSRSRAFVVVAYVAVLAYAAVSNGVGASGTGPTDVLAEGRTLPSLTTVAPPPPPSAEATTTSTSTTTSTTSTTSTSTTTTTAVVVTSPPTTAARTATTAPVARATTTAPTVAAPATQATTGCPDGTYTNTAGNVVCRPYASADPDTPPAGATARCRNGEYSFSQSRQGTCSGNGGVAEWL